MGFLLFLLLSLSSGMPFYLTRRTLQPWLTLEGICLTAVRLLNLVEVPYSLKYLWSPLLDRFSFCWPGRRLICDSVQASPHSANATLCGPISTPNSGF